MSFFTRLATVIKSNLNDLNVQPFEFQGYVETYLGRMITEKKWTSLTVSTAIFLTVAAPVKVLTPISMLHTLVLMQIQEST